MTCTDVASPGLQGKLVPVFAKCRDVLVQPQSVAAPLLVGTAAPADGPTGAVAVACRMFATHRGSRLIAQKLLVLPRTLPALLELVLWVLASQVPPCTAG